MQARTLRGWGGVHKWSSHVCTQLIKLLCQTGLPHIFPPVIDQRPGAASAAPPMPTGTPHITLDRVAAEAVGAYPGLVPLYFFAVVLEQQHLGQVRIGNQQVDRMP
ncbi:hypothetical protein U8L64_00145, partial [Pseudomonas sp. FIP_A4]